MKNLIINNNVFNILVQTVPSAWPNQGRIEFQNVYLKYAPDEAPVLKNLNITIESGWKVTRLTFKKIWNDHVSFNNIYVFNRWVSLEELELVNPH